MLHRLYQRFIVVENHVEVVSQPFSFGLTKYSAVGALIINSGANVCVN